MKPLLRVTTLIVSYVLIQLFNDGRVELVPEDLFTSFFLMGVVVALVYQPKWRKFLFLLCFVLYLMMMISYLLLGVEISNNLGSLAFAILILILISYIPDLSRKGYINT